MTREICQQGPVDISGQFANRRLTPIVQDFLELAENAFSQVPLHNETVACRTPSSEPLDE
jgi:hypothetical protein